MRMVRSFWRDERGATSIEYAMIAGFVSIAIVAAATSIGTRLNARFVAVAGGLS